MPGFCTWWRLAVPLALVLANLLSPAYAVADDKCTGAADWRIDAVQLSTDQDGRVASYVTLGAVIGVQSAALPQLRACAAQKQSPVLLYLDGEPIKGLGEFPSEKRSDNTAWIKLAVTADSRPVWNKLLGGPGIQEDRTINVSLGLADGTKLLSEKTIALKPLPPGWFFAWAAFFLVVLIVFFVTAAYSNLLRGGTPAGGRVFSLGRSQGAWWFFLVLAAYLLIGMTTGDYTTSLNQTALVLLGIASATYLGSAAVDASKDNAAELAAQDAERTRITNKAAAARTPAEVQKLAYLNGESQGWLQDVLSDSEGVDFHRFQMVVWSIVLGVIFVTRVWQDLSMPDFSATLLGLMGLSAGTYVGLKIPETTK
jgi:hypothetical protein